MKSLKTLILSFCFLMMGGIAFSQSFMNEWIDHNKTYYRFRTGGVGFFRITQTQLASIGLGSVDAAHFQLWRKGQEVAVYTSQPSGVLPSNGFIEFWSEQNDGEWESRLYNDPQSHLNPDISLFTDSVTYFLTVNTSGPNKRITPTVNDVSSVLPADPYFMHSLKVNYRNSYNNGFAAVVGSFVYSSIYDTGEGYTSVDIGPAGPLQSVQNNLFVATAGPTASLKYSVVGKALNTRSVRVILNSNQLSEKQMNYFNYMKDEITNIPLSLISSNTATLQFWNIATEPTDRMVVANFELKYPREFNFGGQSSFAFTLDANAAGNNIVISNFNGGSAPVLYDFTNNLRITAQALGGNQYRVVLPPSATARKLIIASTEISAIRSVSGFLQRNFVNYLNAANHGNYLIISNPIVYNDANGVNQVDQYRQYRSSTVGGGYSAKVYDVNELIDQFGWGVKFNPLGIRNFLRFARQNFSMQPKYTLIIGKGATMNLARTIENRAAINRIMVVPSWGVPASDMALAAEEGDIVPKIPIGRLNVINGDEVADYLQKLKEYDGWKTAHSCNPEDEMWKKEIIHIGGANDYLGEQIQYHLGQYAGVAKDTFYGGNVHNFQKSSLTAVQNISGQRINSLFGSGFSLLTYFGHSSASTLEFNLDNPENYPSTGKYPIFLVNGCNAGNLFLADSTRFIGNFTLSEKYLLSVPNKGAVAFIASTSLGIVQYLNFYTEAFYNEYVQKDYGTSIGNILTKTIDTLIRKFSVYDFFVRMHCEQITLHGDPAVTFYTTDKPDYAVTQSSVQIAPEFVSIAENKFNAKVKIYNSGKATTDSVRIKIEREFPNGSRATVYEQKHRYIPYADSINLELPIDAFNDKGANKIIVTIDGDNTIAELCETNNTVTKGFFIFEDEIRPVYPYNFGIVNKQNITYYASTANPLGSNRKYYFEIDTTQKFNSSLLKKDSVTSIGGSIGFKPNGITFVHDRVYYWRVGIKPDAATPVIWNNSSFVFRNNDTGFNQSHYYQYLNNNYTDLVLDTNNRSLDYKIVNRKLAIKTGLFPHFRSPNNIVFLDLQTVDQWRCFFNVFSIYVFEPKTLKSWVNQPYFTGGNGRFMSMPPMCLGFPRKFFEFLMEDAPSRNFARIMLEDSIPAGSIVMIINQGTGQGGFNPANTAFINHWQNDTLTYGPGKSIYHTFINNGLTDINKFTRNLPFAFVYQKGNPEFVRQFIGEKENDYIDVVVDLPAQLTSGSVESPWMGPAKEWKTFSWDGVFNGGQSPADSLSFELYGKTAAGAELKLATISNAKDTSISFIDPAVFPYVKMKMFTADPVNVTPFQLQYWRLTGAMKPEGAIAPNIRFTCKDTVELGEPQNFSVAFRNISEAAFDSLKLKLIVTDRNGAPREIPLPKKRPIASGDSIVVSYSFDTKDLEGQNLIYLMVNPDNDQPEQYLFNNFLYKNFFVKSDRTNPWLDVTFDGVHILNRDIVSSKPHILIKLKDDSKYLALSDTSGLRVKINYPGATPNDPRITREFKLGSDSARFTPASLNNGDNTATVDLFPNFRIDGVYELMVSGADRSGNKAGELEYNVSFEVINKPMISNMLNYPNPFTTSTAFVFTLTGSEVPQNIRIQILTVTGKVVREITKEELGPIRIGRNITEYKWDGTDQFGNKLANGIYLYRVITNQNGKALDQYKATGDKTDQYFNRGYGKMYLMR
ncbi:MAG TPA: C25 family cysteine peptidase [Lacibacter sp.]|nr:C25 family cysteine peptidase [Lacibacter sp.]